MSNKKIQTILSLIEVAEKNLKNSKNLLFQYIKDNNIDIENISNQESPIKNKEEEKAIEVMEGYFDGENMIGDNGQIYTVPQNYASKSQLVAGDRMKWILTNEKEVFKLIEPTPRERVVGTFYVEGDNYIVLVDKYPTPIKMLKASSTYAIKNLGLKPGNEVAIYIPKDTENPIWGAFINVVNPNNKNSVDNTLGLNKKNKTENNSNFDTKLPDDSENIKVQNDIFAEIAELGLADSNNFNDLVEQNFDKKLNNQDNLEKDYF